VTVRYSDIGRENNGWFSGGWEPAWILFTEINGDLVFDLLIFTLRTVSIQQFRLVNGWMGQYTQSDPQSALAMQRYRTVSQEHELTVFWRHKTTQLQELTVRNSNLKITYINCMCYLITNYETIATFSEIQWIGWEMVVADFKIRKNLRGGIEESYGDTRWPGFELGTSRTQVTIAVSCSLH
jgi:hypothetical protein